MPAVFAASQDSKRGLAVGCDHGMVAETSEQRADQQGVDLVVFRDQHGKPANRRVGCGGWRLARVERIVRERGCGDLGRDGQACGERGGAQRLHQIAGEGG